MVKVVAHWKFNPALDKEAAYEHYRNVHGALGWEHLTGVPGLIRYVQNLVVRRSYSDDYGAPPQEREPAFDHSTEFHFVDRESMEAFFGAPMEDTMRQDERNFKDTWMDFYEVQETVVAQRGPDGTFFARLPQPGENPHVTFEEES